jgi:hypothetical protein
MNDHLRERIAKKLELLSDERGYQILDYVEFLESRYAERQTGNAFTRFTEAVEDKLRAGKVSASTIAETMGLMNRAANVLGGALAATQKMASEVLNAPRPGATTTTGSTGTGAPGESTASSTTSSTSTAPPPAPVTGAGSGASSTAGPIEAPGSSGEKL